MVTSVILSSSRVQILRWFQFSSNAFNTKSKLFYNDRLFSSDSNSGRLYTDKHEWIVVNDKIGTVGISHHAQGSLGDIVYAQLPSVGSTLSQDAECGALESVKAASELYCPVSGKVTEKNTCVEDLPALINKSCYEAGWLFKIELSNPSELSKLMDEDKYGEFLKTEINEV